MDPKFADVGTDLLVIFLGQGPGKGKPPWMSLTKVGTPEGPQMTRHRGESPFGAQFGSSQPCPAAYGIPADLLHLGGEMGLMGWEKDLESHWPPSALSE